MKNNGPFGVLFVVLASNPSELPLVQENCLWFKNPKMDLLIFTDTAYMAC